MDYRLDVTVKADHERAIEYRYMRTIVTRRATFFGAEETEDVVETAQFTPPIFILKLTPYHNIMRKMKNYLDIHPDKEPEFIQFDEIKVLPQAAIIAHTQTRPIVKYVEFEEPHLEGSYPVLDLAKVRDYAEAVLHKFKQNRDVNIIEAGYGCSDIWTSSEEFAKAVK